MTRAFTCNDCKRVIRTVADVRGCSRCKAVGRAQAMPDSHKDSEFLTPFMLGYVFAGLSNSSDAAAHEAGVQPSAPAFKAGGGESGGGGASASYDPGPSDSGGSSDSGGGDSGGSSSSET